ncbi:AbaSI family restriction endonuclease, partial [Priestia megaterium]
MSKYDYIKRQLAKTNKKNDENYIITRIWHLLDNYDIKINTQQYVV